MASKSDRFQHALIHGGECPLDETVSSEKVSGRERRRTLATVRFWRRVCTPPDDNGR
jgi:hypothetical protein